jgi:hypothetical protein
VRGLGGQVDAGLGPVGRLGAEHRRALELSGVLVGAIVLMAQSRPTGHTVLVIALVLLAFVALVELVAAAGGAPAAEPS